jgi:epoxide hydrolase 4
MDAISPNMSGFTDGYADVNDVRLHYVSSGHGRLILFLHGFPEFWYQWAHQLAEFGRDWHAVAPDMRGYNLSSKPQDVGQYRLKTLLEDMRALTEHLGHCSFVLVGHDWGGLIAWCFAAYYPDRVEKLVVLNAPHPAVLERELRENPAQQMASSYFDWYDDPLTPERELSKDNFALLSQVVLDDAIKQGHRSVQDRGKYLEAWAQAGALTAAINYYRANLGAARKQDGFWSVERVMPELKSVKITTPTLLLWGLQDPYLLAGNLSGLRRFVPRLTVKLFPDTGHWIVHAKTQQVNAEIRKFLEQENR